MFEDELGSRHTQPAPPQLYRYEINDVIDSRYLVRHRIGQGGMGAVLRVEDLSDQRIRALKYCRDPSFAKRFQREVRMMNQVQSPYVISILGANLDHEPPYFVMELGERSLEDDIQSLRADEATALEVFDEICRGVRELHQSGIFHRDIKPANVLRLPDGSVVISDLGLARFEERDTTILTTTVQHLGTEDYLAQSSANRRVLRKLMAEPTYISSAKYYIS